MVAAAQAGLATLPFATITCLGVHPNGRKSYGHSLAVDSWGTIMGSLDGEHGGILIVGFDREYQKQVRCGMNMVDDVVYE